MSGSDDVLRALNEALASLTNEGYEARIVIETRMPRSALDATKPEHTYTLLEDATYVRDDGQRDVLLSGTKVRLVSASIKNTVDKIENLLQPRGRCTECGGGEFY